MAADEEFYDGSQKRLTQEELDKQIARLTAPPRPVEIRDPFPVCPTVVLSQGEVDKMTERLYSQALERKKANEQELQARFGPDAQRARRKSLTTDEMQHSVDRLYSESLEKKKRSLEETKQRYEVKRKEDKKVPLDVLVQDVYYKRLEAQRKTEEELYQKYIVTTEIRSARIPKSRIAESADRLSTKN